MASNDSVLDPDGPLADLPTYDLDYAVDDGDDPTLDTVYVEGPGAIATNWMTIDVDSAVDLARVACRPSGSSITSRWRGTLPAAPDRPVCLPSPSRTSTWS